MSQSSQQEPSTPQASTNAQDDDWSHIKDPNERRKIQNRLAQRKFREKAKQLREDNERAAENQRRAGAAYTTPEPEQLDEDHEEGLPWGGFSMRHVIETGRAKEQSTRESSMNATASKTGGSSRLGLHLIDVYARGSPAWAAWRERFAGLITRQSVPPPRSWSSTPG